MEKSTPLLVSVTGWSGSGKTSFCETVIAELIKRGFKTAAAKNAHREISLDKPGSDSDRYFRAGADAVCLNAANSLTVFYKQRYEDGNRLYTLFSSYDIIIAEGFKAENALRIEVTGTIDSLREMKNPASEADIIVYGSEKLAEQLNEQSAVLIQRDDIASAADLICNAASSQT